MPFIVQLPKKVERELSLLPDSVFDKILLNLKKLSSNPLLQNFKKLQNRAGYRIRVETTESFMKLFKKKN